jgi:hypothetical protein
MRSAPSSRSILSSESLWKLFGYINISGFICLEGLVTSKILDCAISLVIFFEGLSGIMALFLPF